METLSGFDYGWEKVNSDDNLWRQELFDAPNIEDWQTLRPEEQTRKEYWDVAVETLDLFDRWKDAEKLSCYYDSSNDERAARIAKNAKCLRSTELKKQMDVLAQICTRLGFKKPRLTNFLELANDTECFDSFVDRVHQKRDSQAPTEPLLDLMSLA